MVVVQVLRVCGAIILVVGEAAGCKTKTRVEGAIELESFTYRIRRPDLNWILP